MTEPKWVSRAEVERLHIKVIEAAGGSQGLRDASLLESALARPQNLHAYGEEDIFQLAASYAEGISRNHAFVDGNKRTAFMTADAFLYRNGQELLRRDDDGYVQMMEQLGQGKLDRAAAAAYLRENSRERDSEKSKASEREKESGKLRDWWQEPTKTARARGVDPKKDRDDGPDFER